MNEYELFEKDGTLIKMSKVRFESREHFLIRSYFVLNNLDKDEFNNLVNLSFLFLNVYYHNLKYDDDIHAKLNGYVCLKV